MSGSPSQQSIISGPVFPVLAARSSAAVSATAPLELFIITERGGGCREAAANEVVGWVVAVDCERHMECDNVGTAGYFVEGASGRRLRRAVVAGRTALRACPASVPSSRQWSLHGLCRRCLL